MVVVEWRWESLWSNDVGIGSLGGVVWSPVSANGRKDEVKKRIRE